MTRWHRRTACGMGHGMLLSLKNATCHMQKNDKTGWRDQEWLGCGGCFRLDDQQRPLCEVSVNLNAEWGEGAMLGKIQRKSDPGRGEAFVSFVDIGYGIDQSATTPWPVGMGVSCELWGWLCQWCSRKREKMREKSLGGNEFSFPGQPISSPHHPVFWSLLHVATFWNYLSTSWCLVSPTRLKSHENRNFVLKTSLLSV